MPANQLSVQSLVKKLFNKSPKVSRGDMLGVIEWRAALLKRYFDRVTLDTLGGMYCMSSDPMCVHKLSEDAPIVNQMGPYPEQFSLDTQGVFSSSLSRILDHGENEALQYYGATRSGTTFGISRSGHWLLIQVYYKLEQKNGAYHRAVGVEVELSSVEDILTKTDTDPWNLLFFLRTRISQWVEARKKLYEDLAGTLACIEADDALLALLV